MLQINGIKAKVNLSYLRQYSTVKGKVMLHFSGVDNTIDRAIEISKEKGCAFLQTFTKKSMNISGKLLSCKLKATTNYTFIGDSDRLNTIQVWKFEATDAEAVKGILTNAGFDDSGMEQEVMAVEYFPTASEIVAHFDIDDALLDGDITISFKKYANLM